MSNKLFVGGLAWATTDESLRAAFEPYGDVADARVITDRETGRSRGFGFVTFRADEAAKAAIDAMNGADVDGRPIRVNEAQERQGGPGPRVGGGRPGGPPDRRPGGPPRGDGRPPAGRDYPPVERRGEARSGPGGAGGGFSGGGPPAGGGAAAGAGTGGSGTALDPNGKPAGRKRHNGAPIKRKGARNKDQQEEADPRGEGAGGRKRRGGGNRRRFDDYHGDW